MSSLCAYPPTAYSRFPIAATPTRARRVDMEATTCQRSVRVSYASQSPWMANRLPPPGSGWQSKKRDSGRQGRGGSSATQVQSHEGSRGGRRGGLGHTGAPHKIGFLTHTGHKCNGFCLFRVGVDDLGQEWEGEGVQHTNGKEHRTSTLTATGSCAASTQNTPLLRQQVELKSLNEQILAVRMMPHKAFSIDVAQ